MDLGLYEAARTGNTSSLHSLLEKDPLILERGSLDRTAETCLHIAALAGRVEFVKEIMSLKPEMAERLNKDGFLPIHMASANGYTDVVKELLKINKELISRPMSSDGRTALHFAVITGSLDVLNELINTCPECVPDLTNRGESALHIAVNNHQFEAFKLIWSVIIRTDEINWLVNAKDQDDNTILHIAVAKKQLRVIQLLLDQAKVDSVPKVDVSAKNVNGHTALDMLHHPKRSVDDPVDRQIYDMLLQAGKLTSMEIIVDHNSTVANHQEVQHADTDSNQVSETNATQTLCNYCNLSRPWKFIVQELSSLFNWNIWSTLTKEIKDSKPEVQNALMVVAVLIATISYQSVLSPPGGYRQFNASDDPDPAHANGIAIISSDALVFGFVIFFSSVGFFLSVVMILMLTSQFPLKTLLRLAVLAVSADFICTILYIAPIGFNIIYVVIMVMFVLVGLHLLYFMSWVLSWCRLPGRKQAP